MATPRAEDVLESGCWDLDELSEMKSLLQRAERRLEMLETASKHAMKARKTHKYATANHLPMLQI